MVRRKEPLDGGMNMLFFHKGSEVLAQVAQRGGGASSLKTSKVRLEGL